LTATPPQRPAADGASASIDEVSQITPDFRRIDIGRMFPKVQLTETTAYGYLLVAAEIDRRSMLLPNSRRKDHILRDLRRMAAKLLEDRRVVDAYVFDGILDTLGRGEVVKQDRTVRPARFDVVVLVEATSPEAAQSIRGTPTFARVEAWLNRESDHTYWLRATTVRSIRAVDHTRSGVFLFNFFYARRTDLNLAAQYTASWFWDQIGLNNSMVLLPEDSSEARFRLINHARWDRLRDVLPALILQFHGETLGLDFAEANGMLTLGLRGGGMMLIYPKAAHKAAAYTGLNFPVAEIEPVVDWLAERDISFDRYESLGQDDRGISRAGGPLIAWFRDPAGNILSVLEVAE